MASPTHGKVIPLKYITGVAGVTGRSPSSRRSASTSLSGMEPMNWWPTLPKHERNMGVPGPQGTPYWELPGWFDDGFRQGYPGPKGQMKEGTDNAKRQDYKGHRSGRKFDVVWSAGLGSPINGGILVKRRNMGVPGPQGTPYWELPGWSDDGFRQGYPGPKGQMREGTDTTKRQDYKRHHSGRGFDVVWSAGLGGPINDGILVKRHRKIFHQKHTRSGPDQTDI